jgi:stage V sporulation protein AD
MAVKKLGKQTIKFNNPPSIISTASIVGPKEGQGPLAKHFDMVLNDDMFGEKSFEKAECKMVKETALKAIR